MNNSTVNVDAIVCECEALDDEGLVKKSADLLSAAIDISPCARLYHERGVRNESLNRHDAALDDYSMAIALEPNHMKYWLSRGRLLSFILENPVKAEKDFIAAANIDATSPHPHQYLCLNYLHRNMQDLAFEHASLALRLDDSDAFSHFCMGKCKLATEDYRGAIDSFCKAQELDPSSSMYCDALGDLYFKCGEFSESLRAYEEAASVEPSPTLLIRIARLSIKLQDIQKAAKYLDMAKGYGLTEAESVLVEGYLQIVSDSL